MEPLIAAPERLECARAFLAPYYDNMAEGGDFQPEAWASKHHLNRNTTRALRREELLDVELLKVLTRRDINRLELSVGQARALICAVAAVGNPIQVTDEEERAEDEQNQAEQHGDDEEEAGDLPLQLQKANEDLDRFLAQDADRPAVAVGPGAGGAGPVYPNYDPRMNLTVKAVTKKAHQVISFLPEAVRTKINRRKRDRMVLSDSPGGTVSLKMQDGGQVYISWDEWSAANTRIMAHMLREGDLRRADVEYYLAYLTYIYELVPHYEWTSILEFDTRYREIQAQHGFPWGTLAPHLDTVLVAKKAMLGSKGKGSGDKQRVRSEDKNQICKMFATRGTCPFGAGCKYRHEKGASASATKNE